MEDDKAIRLFDGQWVNIVNHDDCYAFYSKDEAVEKAVRLTEEAMARNLQEGKWPTHRRE
jgi:hypothetical protein